MSERDLDVPEELRAQRPPGSGRTDDPEFATPQQDNPMAAEDLKSMAAQEPRTDKQGDPQPAGNQ